MIIMAVDLGLARTGIAVCDKEELIAYPLDTIREKDFKKLIIKIIEKIHKTKAQRVVLGLPKNMDGSEGSSARRSYELKEELEGSIDIEVVLWDERKTTSIANTYLNCTNTRGKKRKSIIDTVSATIILQDYIKFKNSGK